MNYSLIKSSNNDINKLIEYKKETIFKYADNLSDEEIDRINNYINNNVPKEINNYYNIIGDDSIIGCLLLVPHDDGILLDELYLEEDYRNKGIGTRIIKKVIEENNIVYLWVYKLNTKAISLYKKLNFKVVDETESRYYMKYENIN